jgi:hypothetical protein
MINQKTPHSGAKDAARSSKITQENRISQACFVKGAAISKIEIQVLGEYSVTSHISSAQCIV